MCPEVYKSLKSCMHLQSYLQGCNQDHYQNLEIGLINLNPKDSGVTSIANNVYTQISGRYEVLYDDKNDNVGVKFSRMDLIGLPHQIIVGSKAVSENQVEYKNKNLQIVKKSKKVINTRQAAPNVYDMNASIYIFRRSFLIKKKKVINTKTQIFLMPRERSIDIDDKFDLCLVKLLLKNEKKLSK